jgi:hypothetical protein
MHMIESKTETAAAIHRALPPAEQEALIERIAASPQLRRAARLREFLLFVAKQNLLHGSAPIHEQEIGAAVFERPASYDTSVDNIVRVNATELRKRLEQYFAEDGAEEPVVVEMPRGSYSLTFRPRVATAAGLDTVVAAEAPVEPVPPAEAGAAPVVQIRDYRVGLLLSVVVILLLVCGGLFWQNQQLRKEAAPWRNTPALRSFWSEFFDSGHEVDIVLADTSFALAEDIEGRTIPLTSYLNYDYKYLDAVPGLSPDRREDLKHVLDRNNGSVGDTIVAQRILALAPSAPALHLKFAREYSAEAIKTNSVILIGSRESNPWVQLFDARMNFSMDYDPVVHRSAVHNRQPKPGEEAEYVRTGGVSLDAGLSIVALMPDLSRNGSALLIEGTDSQATRAAGEFVTSDASLSAFLDQIHSKNIPYFEILLENSQVTGTPLRSHILAYRIYPRTGNSAANESGHL